ncbi:hypothetical protein WMF28_11065 [Sorangium sp. So ce590]|uniref:hypothetical protein n=1 Tax=Sorangium sp. So ce590 TaxID=3133317 RepID=UPI003F61CC75
MAISPSISAKSCRLAAACASRGDHFDPCELLAADARGELRPEFRERDVGGGWRARSAGMTRLSGALRA